MKQVTVKIGQIYFQIASDIAKKRGVKIDNFLNDLISQEYQRKK